jgi:hypothetical protein
MRFSGAQLGLAMVAGIAIGIFAGIQYEIHETLAAEPSSVSLPLPPPPSAANVGSATTPKQLGRPSIIDEIDVTNFLGDDAEKPGR